MTTIMYIGMIATYIIGMYLVGGIIMTVGIRFSKTDDWVVAPLLATVWLIISGICGLILLGYVIGSAT